MSCRFSVDLSDVIGPLSVLDPIRRRLLGKAVDTRVKVGRQSYRASVVVSARVDLNSS